uniref:NADH-ubiquinone oxidoreductase chain 4 n=1 Tax=Cloacotaenia megalops TaxID=576527 RepID=A0A1L2FZF0_9CEST|nr:NADH dehydrogenase subunit 4 [Cloacotaenia megalops]AOG66048.1 NADH dehydrogenase subunit 4 [Cloacotaenia megalops]
MSVIQYYSFSFFLSTCVFSFFLLCYNCTMGNESYGVLLSNNYFIFDSLSFYLISLVIILGAYSLLFFSSYLEFATIYFLILSLVFSVIAFCINHSILFWCFYELSMLPLLYLIFCYSPYSERFLAGWYFVCYILVTSLPLLLIIIYLSAVNESLFFSEWSQCNASLWLFIILMFIFFTKVPLAPFHTWLPIVHAEATSIVSIFLSGYIMKLGILGVYRCCYFLFNNYLVVYLFFCCIISIFFFITAANELDGKRWLAFLSLSHIVVPFLSFFVSDWSTINFSFLYCLGHGISAGLVFGLLWYLYELSNSRSWVLLKSSIGSKIIMIVTILSLLSLCSFPTTIQFFCEVSLIKFSVGYYLYILFWCFYLFFGGLVPLILCGHVLIRSEWSESLNNDSYSYLNFLIVLCLWCYLGFFLL